MVDIDALAGAGSDRRQSRGNRDMRVGIAADHGVQFEGGSRSPGWAQRAWHAVGIPK
jgi:hypothetical protein